MKAPERRNSSPAQLRLQGEQGQHLSHGHRADSGDTGNADGLGETRKKELVKSGMTLGLRQEDDVFVVDSPYARFSPIAQ